MNLAAYRKRWELLSLDVGYTVETFAAFEAATAWQQRAFLNLGQAKLGKAKHVAAANALGNALVISFFIRACRMRESSRSKISLPILFEEAMKGLFFEPIQLTAAKTLLHQTKDTFEKLKKIRGKTIAHNATEDDPFDLIESENLTTEKINRYIEDCSELCALLAPAKNVRRMRPRDELRSKVTAAFERLVCTRSKRA